MDYPDFVRLLVNSCFLMTDGGSNQEEAAMMGLPTLLMRRATERPDGRDCIRDFVEGFAGKRWRLRLLQEGSPSSRIVDVLQGH